MTATALGFVAVFIVGDLVRCRISGMKATVLLSLILAVSVSAAAQSTILTLPVRATGCLGAGDLNGDGIPDVVVGLPPFCVLPGCVKALSGANGSVLWQSCVPGPTSYGRMVALAGDLNADGKSEIIVGAPGEACGPPPYPPGAPMVILSGATGALFRTLPCTPFSPIGHEGVDGGGDFDGDGVPDQVGNCTSGVRVYSGLTGAEIFNTGSSGSAHFIKDLTGDGTDELGVVSGSSAQVYSGPSGTPFATILGAGAEIVDVGDLNLDGLSEIALCDTFTFAIYDISAGGNIPQNASLWSLPYVQPFPYWYGVPARLPDLDGDGIAELVHCYSFYSGSGGFPAGATALRSGATGALISTMPGGCHAGGQGGGPVAPAGDVNLDGIPDFIRAYVFQRSFGSIWVGRLEVVSSVTWAAGSVTSLGGACGEFPTALSAGPLLLGQTWSFSIQNAKPFASGALVLDVGAPAPSPLGSCVVQIDLSHAPSWTLLPLSLDAGGAGQASIAVPPILTAIGASVVVQAVVLGTASPLGVDISNGLLGVAGL